VNLWRLIQVKILKDFKETQEFYTGWEEAKYIHKKKNKER
jgi:hypothetical protein